MPKRAKGPEAIPKALSEGEERFAEHCRAYLSVIRTMPCREYEFCDGRKWRFDFAWPSRRIAVEIEGGTWSGGRHTRGSGYLGDIEKYNMASFLGWHIYRFTTAMVSSGAAIDIIRKALS